MLRIIVCGLLMSVMIMLSALASDKPVEQRQLRVPDELKPISFMVGDWRLDEIYSDDPENIVKVQTATLHVGEALNGDGIQIQSSHPYGDEEEVFTAIKTFSVRQDTRQVVGVSINNLGNRKTLSVAVNEDEIVVRTDGELFGGGKGYNLGTYRQITEDSFEFRLDRCMGEDAPCILNTYSFVAHRLD